MKRLFIILFSSIILSGCETVPTNNTSYFQHYERCAQTNEKLKDIYVCGRANRQFVLDQSPGNRSAMGDRYEDYIYQLVKAIDNKAINEDVAKLEFYKVTQAARRDLQNMMVAASIYSQQQQAQSQALINQGMSMLNGQSNTSFNSSTNSSIGMTYPLSSNYVSGMNRICIYKLGAMVKTKTINGISLCPMSY